MNGQLAQKSLATKAEMMEKYQTNDVVTCPEWGMTDVKIMDFDEKFFYGVTGMGEEKRFLNYLDYEIVVRKFEQLKLF